MTEGSSHRKAGFDPSALAAVVTLIIGAALVPAARATLDYGPLQLSGSVDSQTLLRVSEIDQWQFVQNRNTALLRLDYRWFQNGKLVDRFDIPFVKRSQLYILYRGVYDSFWGIAPGGRQKGVTSLDDKIGGPITGPVIGKSCTTPACVCPPTDPGCSTLIRGIYSSIGSEGRTSNAFENTLREAYVDLTLADAPLIFRLGRQQVIWGESDQLRLMDIINPLDLTWHLQQEEWDKIRIPLWLVKIIWDMGDLGPISNAFTEVVWNPGDYVPGAKLKFLPAPWSVPTASPVRPGQILLFNPESPDTMVTPVFNLQGTSFLRGDFNRNPGEASDIGVRFHGITDIPLVDMQGVEFTANYLYARGRSIGAQVGTPFALKIEKITADFGQRVRQNPADPKSAPALFAGKTVIPATVMAEFIHPYTHIFGTTANWFEATYTNTVFRMEMAYQLGAPFQTAALDERVGVDGIEAIKAPIGFTKRDVWAGMVGFDRPTWIKFLNPRTTWFLTGQLFWSFVNGTHSMLRAPIFTASKLPYYRPPEGDPSWNANTTNGFGQWTNGPFAGQIERTQTVCTVAVPGLPCQPSNLNGNADRVLQWEMLATLAAFSFYRGGTVVPFALVAIDPMNRNLWCQLKVDYFVTNNLITQLRAGFLNDLGSGRVTLDPWAIGLSARRDEVGLKLTYQF